MEDFYKLGLSVDVVETLKKKGFKKPTAIQEKTIPILLKGDFDVIGQAQTGTGKTASFVLPIIETISEKTGYIQAVILAPTRELAIQVSNEIQSLRGKRILSVLTVYGGSSITNQIRSLRKGVDIVVGTPGRVMDLMRRKELHLSHVSYVVLDEADEMLNMGFIDDIKWILGHTKDEKRMLFFSATMPKPILSIAKKFMREYVVVQIESPELTIDTIDQVYYSVKSNQRYSALRRIIAVNKGFHGIIFCKTRRNVDDLSRRLQDDGYLAAGLHGEITQAQREKILQRFRNRNVMVLVATDVAARGIDVNDLTHVVNYSIPQQMEAYVHRIGRTGRAGKTGTAITFLIPSESSKLKSIERVTKKEIRRGALPSAEDVIATKQEDMVRAIAKVLQKQKFAQYNEVASVLLAENSPQDVVAAVLKYAVQKDLDKNVYDQEVQEYEVKQKTGKRANSGRARKRTNRRGGRSPEAKDRKRSERKDGKRSFSNPDRKSSKLKRDRQVYGRKPSKPRNERSDSKKKSSSS
jgi:ATP-dependent RNA helicase DeaD